MNPERCLRRAIPLSNRIAPAAIGQRTIEWQRAVGEMENGGTIRRHAQRRGDLVGQVVERVDLEQVESGVAQPDARHPVEQRATRRLGQGALARRAQRLEPGELGRDRIGGHAAIICEKYLIVKCEARA
jgi:hypothetical protein